MCALACFPRVIAMRSETTSGNTEGAAQDLAILEYHIASSFAGFPVTRKEHRSSVNYREHRESTPHRREGFLAASIAGRGAWFDSLFFFSAFRVEEN